MTIATYDFAEAERIRYGRFPVLDTVLYRWARKIEETLFERFRIELYAGSSVVEEMKFSAFYGSIKTPRPVYVFNLEPFQGDGLFVVDNRFASLCLNAGAGAEGEPARSNQGLSAGNHDRLQRVVQQLMADLDESWADIVDVKTRLKKVTTYLFRARVLNAFEPCLVAQIHLSGAQASARLAWCFPRIMLEPILPQLTKRRIIPSLYPGRAANAAMESSRLLEQLNYRLRVNLGSVNLQEGSHGLRVGSVLPLANDVGGQAVIQVNGAPVLVGNVGEVQGSYAVRVTGPYAPQPRSVQPSPGAFQAIRWPNTLPE